MKSISLCGRRLQKRLRDECPEVEKTCCVLSADGKIKYGQQEVKSKDDQEGIIMLADSTFFQFFDFDLVKGDRLTALDAPDKCVITEQLAKRLFGSKDPIGESLQIVGNRHVHIVDINGTDPYDSTLVYTISAVAKDLDHTVLPNETQIIASMERYPQVAGYRLEKNSFAYASTGAIKAFLMQKPSANLLSKKKQIQDYLQKNYTNAWGNYELSLTPLTDVMFAPQNLLTGIISGIMPSWQISRYQPIDIVKGSFRFRSKMVLGKVFVILQNVITVTMLTSALVIWLQLNHLIHAPLGFNTKNLYYVYAPQGKFQVARNLLEKMPFVEEIGVFQEIPHSRT